MPRTVTVTFDDGTSHVYQNVPDSATPEQVQERAVKDFGKQLTNIDGGRQVSVQAGSTLRDIPRQVGLAARYGAEGLASVADIGAEPIRQLVVNPALRAAGLPQARSVSGAVSEAADAIGLPSPKTPDERVVGDATRMVAASIGFGGAAQQTGKALSGVPKQVATMFAANPGTQAVGAASAGLAGGAVREAGGGPVEQFVASLVGGVAGGVGAQGALRAYDKAAARFTPKQIIEQRADREISLILERSGIDWGQVPQNIKAGLRAEVAAAMNTGQPLNPDAVRRLLVFKRAGVTPTVGMLTQNPAQITAEKNLAKTGANSTDKALQRLPELENQNVAALLNQLDEAGAATAPSAIDAGRAAVGNLKGNLASARASNAALYQQARDSAGRSVPLDGPAAAQAAVQRLKADGVGKLPAEVDQWLNDLTTGKTPLTVDYQQQLVRNLYRKMRGTQDGDLRHGFQIVREALDNAEPLPSPQVNPRNLPAVRGTVPPSNQTIGQEAIDAYRKARAAHRTLMQRIEANPALAAVDDGMEPDQFVQRFVIGKGASVADVGALVKELRPEPREAMRQFLARHLKDAATNNTDDITKFSNHAYRKALRDIGDEKLSLFFSKDELQKLRDIGDAAKYMQAQPAGTAVNNSNSGALVLGRGYDLLDRLANKVPLGGRDVIKGIVQGRQQTQVLQPRNALTLAADSSGIPLLPVNPLVALTGPVQAREDDRRK